MNPLSLLTKGNTFGGIKDRRGAYKVSSHYVLPNFTGSKPPTPAVAHHPPTTPLQTALFEPPKPAIPVAVPIKRDGAVPAAPKAPAKEVRPVPDSFWSRAARWWNELLAGQQNWPRPAPSIQTELALNKITVVRNDLSEDDLEVVMVEKTTRPSVEPAAPVRQMAKP